MDSQINDTVPLVFEAGWTHLVCGGDAEKSVYYGEAYCIPCRRTVPSREVGKVLDQRLKIGYTARDDSA